MLILLYFYFSKILKATSTTDILYVQISIAFYSVARGKNELDY